MQNVIWNVEQWTNKWGFKLSISKSQVICFSKCPKTVILHELYGQDLEQVKVVRYLGVFFDEMLTWWQHIDKVGIHVKRLIMF